MHTLPAVLITIHFLIIVYCIVVYCDYFVSCITILLLAVTCSSAATRPKID